MVLGALLLALVASGPDIDALVLPADYVAQRASSHDPDPKSNNDSWPLPSGKAVTLLEADGPGVVTHIWMTVADNEYAWPRLLRLRVYYDGASKPSVDVPVGDFFACGHGTECDVDSLMVRCTSQGRAKNAYWPMPYRKHVRMTLTNEGEGRAGMVYFQVDYRKYSSLPKDVQYFHAWYRQESPAKMGRYYSILETTGKGKYVGTVLNVIPNEEEWFGEGDDYFTVDGEKTPSLSGTGTEDFIGDAWGLHEHSGPYYGVTAAGGFGTGTRASAYRWQIPDPVPFTKSLKVEIEHAGWARNPDGTIKGSFVERPDEFSSVAFWYQTPFRTDLPEPPAGKARLPYGNATSIQAEVQFKGITAEGGAPIVQEGVFWFQDIVFFPAKGPEAQITIPFEVPEDARYEVQPLLVLAPDYGAYTVALDGGAPSGPIDLYASEVLMPRGFPIARAQLSKGRHTLTFRCVGKSGLSTGHYLGIDQIVLSKLR